VTSRFWKVKNEYNVMHDCAHFAYLTPTKFCEMLMN